MAKKKVAGPVALGPSNFDKFMNPSPWAALMGEDPSQMGIDVASALAKPAAPPAGLPAGMLSMPVSDKPAAPVAMEAAPAAAVSSPAQVAEATKTLSTALGQPPGMAANNFQNKVQAQSGIQRRVVQDTYLSPEDYQALVDAAESVTPVQEQKKRLADLDKLNAASISSIPDYEDKSPLLNLIDTWTGSKLAAGYKRPMGTEDRAKILMEYGAKTKSDHEKVLQDVLKAAQYMKSGTALDQATSGFLASTGMGRSAPRATGGAGTGAKDDWKVIQEGNKVGKEFEESKSRLDAVRSALASGQLGDVKRALSLAARELSGEKGVLTDQDIGRILPNTIGMTADQFAAWISNDPSVQLNPAILQGLRAEIPRALARLQSRNAAKIATLQESMKNSPAFRGKTTLLDPFKNSMEKTQGPAAEPSLKDMFKEFVKKGAPKK